VLGDGQLQTAGNFLRLGEYLHDVILRATKLLKPVAAERCEVD